MMSAIYSKGWYKNATVRKMEVLPLKKDSQYPFFPRDLLPLCDHPLFKKFGKEAEHYLLTQFCYKYLQEICITETDVVNPTSLSIAYGSVPVKLSEDDMADAFSIIVDEAFHSYVARRFLLQVVEFTGIEPLCLAHENEATKAISNINAVISDNIRPDFELIATCISENIFTDEIIRVSRFTNVNESFHQLMVEHARDEGRHAGYFIRVLEAYWKQASDDKKCLLADIIPKFLHYCLDGVHDAQYIKLLLQTYGFSDEEVSCLLSENKSGVIVNAMRARIENIVRCLARAGLMEYAPLASALSAYELMVV